jgi:hypothetical protein
MIPYLHTHTHTHAHSHSHAHAHTPMHAHVCTYHHWQLLSIRIIVSIRGRLYNNILEMSVTNI